MFVFILLHALASETGVYMKSNQSIMPIIGGFSPSTAHDSLSTRNPAIEDFFAILADLPGAYTFYLSPLFVTPPVMTYGTVNGNTVPRIGGIDSFYGPVEYNRLVLFLIIIVFAVMTLFFAATRSVIKRRTGERSHEDQESD